MSASNWVHVDVDQIKRETENSFLVVIDGEEIWLPKSHIEDSDDYVAGDADVCMSITQWIANKKDLD